MAMLANAVMERSGLKSAPIMTANFVSRSEPGDAEIHVDVIAQSKQFDRYQCRLVQAGMERIRAFATLQRQDGSMPTRRYERSEPPVATLEQSIPIPEMPNYTLYRQMDVRLDPSCAGWLAGSVSQFSEIKGWIRFKEDRPFDVFAAILISDAFPPAVLPSHGMLAWVPTIEFSVNIVHCAPTRWVKCRFHTSFIHNGIFEERGEMWDEKGDLVGLAHQYAQVRTA